MGSGAGKQAPLEDPLEESPSSSRAMGHELKHWDLGEVERVIRVFRKLDADGSGTVERAELALLLPGLDQGITKEKLDSLTQEITHGGDRITCFDFFRWYTGSSHEAAEVAFNQYASLFANKHTPSSSKPLAEWTSEEVMATLKLFAAFDKNKSHTLDVEEVAELGTVLGMGKQKLDKMWKQLATDATITDKVFFQWYAQCNEAEAREVFDKYESLFFRYPKERALATWSSEEVTKTLMLFRRFDADGSGTISRHELATLVAILGLEAKMADLQDLCNTKKDINEMRFFQWYADCSEEEVRKIYADHEDLFSPCTRGTFSLSSTDHDNILVASRAWKPLAFSTDAIGECEEDDEEVERSETPRPPPAEIEVDKKQEEVFPVEVPVEVPVAPEEVPVAVAGPAAAAPEIIVAEAVAVAAA